MKKPPKKLIDLMKKHDIHKSDLWDCHGTWVLKHSAVEYLGAAEGVCIVDIEVVHLNIKDKEATIKCNAKKGDLTVSTFGECAPYNNKNSYPVAMAEKRAVDRATLKLLQMHGGVYSEIEADDFRKSKSSGGNGATAEKSGDVVSMGGTMKAMREVKRG